MGRKGEISKGGGRAPVPGGAPGRRCAYILTDNLSTGLIIGGITVILIFISHPKQRRSSRLQGRCGDTGDLYRISGSDDRQQPELPYPARAGMAASGRILCRRRISRLCRHCMRSDPAGFSGKGPGNSAQKLGTIPEAQNDMIFSIVCEELGISGA